jgi:acyl-coenzyme A synthetase/AMP-(fatty) acid ligase
MDGSGSLRLVDRLKDVIRVGEEWVSSTALEQALNGHEDIQEAAVVGVADLEHGEIPLAVIVLVGERELCAKQLRAMIPSELLAPGVPMPVITVAALPRAPTGKVSKRALRELHG